MKKATYPLDLLDLDKAASVPLHLQLRDALRGMILKGELLPQERIPSIRSMAGSLGVSRNTVVAAFEQLIAEGFIESRRGAGCWVANTAVLDRIEQRAPPPAKFPPLSKRGALMIVQPRIRSFPGKIAFHPGSPETATFPFKTWGAIMKSKSTPGGEDLFGYHALNGLESLRTSISNYLTVSRGVRCTPEQIVVTTGGQAALDLLARLLIDGGDVVWMEEPGFLGAQSAFKAAGAALLPLNVSEAGWDVPSAHCPSPRLIYVTPSCQHPVGVSMPLPTRLALIEIAQEKQTWIIEDDYDGEYNFYSNPLPAMQGLTGSAPVIYVGTFAKTLFPSLRLGYAVMPQGLAEKAKHALNFTGQYPPLILQATLADFISQGHFFRHLNRMRRLYASRRKLFLDLCEAYVSDWLRPIDTRSGIQITCLSLVPIDDGAIARQAAVRNLNLAPLSRFSLSANPRTGFVMGYAGVPEPQMEASFSVLRELLKADT